jgi:hypothetical protein
MVRLNSIKIFSFLMIFFLTGSYLVSGSTDYLTVDELTFRLYQEKKWDSLIIVGKQALKDDIDYYFLRMRMGVAFYSKMKYIPAAEHFRKATVFNSSDPVAWEYLYYSYLLANRNNEAYNILKRMPADLRNKYSGNRNFLEVITLEGGPTLSSNNNKPNSLDIKNAGENQSGGPYGETDLYGNSYYCRFGLLTNLSNRVRFNAAYNYLNFSKTKYFQYTQYENILDSTKNYWWGYENYYHVPPAMYTLEFPYQVRQHELHLGSVITLGKGFTVEPAIHFLWVNYENIKLDYTSTTITDTLVYDSIIPYVNTVDVQKENHPIMREDTNFVNYVFSLGISKDFSVFNIRLNGSISNLNNKKQQ